MDLVVGLDSGTTATKAVAVAADAGIIATSSVGYPLLMPEPGYAELDSVQLQQAAVQALADVVQAGTRGRAPSGWALPQRGDARACADGSRWLTDWAAHHLGG